MIEQCKHKKEIIQSLYIFYVKNDNFNIKTMLYDKFPALCEEASNIKFPCY